MAQPHTALSPEWDRWFDETFTDLIAGDEDLTRAEFNALITASWPLPTPPTSSDVPARTPDPDSASPQHHAGP